MNLSNVTCEYSAFNATTGCFQPRTCAECLGLSGCMIGRAGRCRSATNANPEQSFRRATPLNLSVSANPNSDSGLRYNEDWEFAANEATYCAVNDEACTTCLAGTLIRGAPIDNRFCTGTNGCVCIASCERPAGDPVCPDKGKVEDVGLEKLPSLPTADECRYASKDATTGCLTYRTCTDCLAKRGCEIGIDGYCESQTSSNRRYDYRIAINSSIMLPFGRMRNVSGLSGDQHWQFPASDFNYCPTNDTMCTECIKQNYWRSRGAADDSHFCVGDTGCICVANCARIDKTYCPTLLPSHPNETQNSGDGISHTVTIMAVFLLIFVVTVITLIGFCCYSAHKRRQAPKEAIPVARVVGDETSVTEDELATAMYVVVEPSPPHGRL